MSEAELLAEYRQLAHEDVLAAYGVEAGGLWIVEPGRVRIYLSGDEG